MLVNLRQTQSSLSRTLKKIFLAETAKKNFFRFLISAIAASPREKMLLNGVFQSVHSLTVGSSEHRIAPLLTGPLSNILGLLFILSL